MHSKHYVSNTTLLDLPDEIIRNIITYIKSPFDLFALFRCSVSLIPFVRCEVLHRNGIMSTTNAYQNHTTALLLKYEAEMDLLRAEEEFDLQDPMFN
jgi:hypothetical protein